MKSISKLNKFFFPRSDRPMPKPQTQPCELASQRRSSRPRRITSSISKVLPSSLRRRTIDVSSTTTPIRQLTQQSTPEPVDHNEVLAIPKSQPRNARSNACQRAALPKSQSSEHGAPPGQGQSHSQRLTLARSCLAVTALMHLCLAQLLVCLSSVGYGWMTTSRTLPSIKKRLLRKSIIRERPNCTFLGAFNLLVERPYQYVYHQECQPLSDHRPPTLPSRAISAEK